MTARLCMVLVFAGPDADRLLAMPGVLAPGLRVSVVVERDGARVAAVASEAVVSELEDPPRRVGAGS